MSNFQIVLSINFRFGFAFDIELNCLIFEPIFVLNIYSEGILLIQVLNYSKIIRISYVGLIRNKLITLKFSIIITNYLENILIQRNSNKLILYFDILFWCNTNTEIRDIIALIDYRCNKGSLKNSLPLVLIGMIIWRCDQYLKLRILFDDP